MPQSSSNHSGSTPLHTHTTHPLAVGLQHCTETLVQCVQHLRGYAITWKHLFLEDAQGLGIFEGLQQAKYRQVHSFTEAFSDMDVSADEEA
jgi:hypothetical protein